MRWCLKFIVFTFNRHHSLSEFLCCLYLLFPLLAIPALILKAGIRLASVVGQDPSLKSGSTQARWRLIDQEVQDDLSTASLPPPTQSFLGFKVLNEMMQLGNLGGDISFYLFEVKLPLHLASFAAKDSVQQRRLVLPPCLHSRQGSQQTSALILVIVAGH